MFNVTMPVLRMGLMVKLSRDLFNLYCKVHDYICQSCQEELMEERMLQYLLNADSFGGVECEHFLNQVDG